MLDTRNCHRLVVDHIVNERKRLGLQQAEIAQRLGQHQSFISRLESGARRIEVCEFFLVARAIGFDPHAALVQLMGKNGPGSSAAAGGTRSRTSGRRRGRGRAGAPA